MRGIVLCFECGFQAKGRFQPGSNFLAHESLPFLEVQQKLDDEARAEVERPAQGAERLLAAGLEGDAEARGAFLAG